MTEDTISQQQLDTIEELIRLNERKGITIKDALLLPFFLYYIVIKDWQNYTATEKAVFLFIWSPLLWLLPTLLMEI